MKYKLQNIRRLSRNFKIVGGTIILMIIFSCSKVETNDCFSYSFPDAYEFPIKPGTQDWINLGSREARANACMIPEDILQKISTGGLFESLLSYPFILDYIAWEEWQVGFEALKTENKGFAELFNRRDLYRVIYDWYESMSPDCKEWIYHPDHAPIQIELGIIEMCIFQDEFLNSLNQDEIIEIFKLISYKLQLKIDQGCSEAEKWIPLAILGKIMYREEFKPFIVECNNNEFIRFFIDSIPFYRPVKIDPIEIISRYAKEFYLFPYRY